MKMTPLFLNLRNRPLKTLLYLKFTQESIATGLRTVRPLEQVEPEITLKKKKIDFGDLKKYHFRCHFQFKSYHFEITRSLSFDNVCMRSLYLAMHIRLYIIYYMVSYTTFLFGVVETLSSGNTCARWSYLAMHI